MASTVVGRALTEAHRLGQLRVRARVLRAVVAAWPLYDIEDPSTWPPLEQLLLVLIGSQAPVSAALSSNYYRAFRHVEGAVGTVPTVVASTLPAEEIVRSLRYVGVVGARKLLDANVPAASVRTLTNVAGDTARLVMNSGRDTIIESVTADPRALGWSRVTDGNPCAFCRMLASRGPVYRTKAGGFKAHNHCGCTAEPVFRADAEWPGRAREWHDQWNETTKGLSGRDARLAFRQAVEGRTPVPAGP